MTESALLSRPDGAHISAESQGNSDLPTLLLSNSLATSRTLWDPLMPSLLKAFRVLRYDTRGHGDSTIPTDQASLGDLASDAFAVLDHFGIERAIVAGISLGGMTAMTMALANPSRIAGVLACNCRASVDQAGRAAWEERIAVATTQGMAALAVPTMERWFPQAFRQANAAAMADVARMINATDPNGFVACIRAITGSTLGEHLKEISVPTRFVAGDSDGAAPPDLMASMAAQVNGAQCVTLTACGHLSSINQSAALLREIESFAAFVQQHN